MVQYRTSLSREGMTSEEGESLSERFSGPWIDLQAWPSLDS